MTTTTMTFHDDRASGNDVNGRAEFAVFDTTSSEHHEEVIVSTTTTTDKPAPYFGHQSHYNDNIEYYMNTAPSTRKESSLPTRLNAAVAEFIPGGSVVHSSSSYHQQPNQQEQASMFATTPPTNKKQQLNPVVAEFVPGKTSSMNNSKMMMKERLSMTMLMTDDSSSNSSSTSTTTTMEETTNHSTTNSTLSVKAQEFVLPSSPSSWSSQSSPRGPPRLTPKAKEFVPSGIMSHGGGGGDDGHRRHFGTDNESLKSHAIHHQVGLATGVNDVLLTSISNNDAPVKNAVAHGKKHYHERHNASRSSSSSNSIMDSSADSLDLRAKASTFNTSSFVGYTAADKTTTTTLHGVVSSRSMSAAPTSRQHYAGRGMMATASKRYNNNPPGDEVPICRFFIRGGCQKGKDCRFRHDKDETRFPLAAASTSSCTDGDVVSGNEIDNSRTTYTSATGGSTTTSQLYRVEDGIRCEFDDGFAVRRLLLGDGYSGDAGAAGRSGKGGMRTISLSGLTRDVSTADIETRLLNFGSLSSSVQRKTDSYAIATYEVPSDAEKAIKELNGCTTDSWISNSRGSNNFASSSREREIRSSRMNRNIATTTSVVSVSGLIQRESSLTTKGVNVKVMWYAPSRCAWAHFSTMKMALDAARACHQKVFHGRILTANVQAPSVRQKESFSIWIGGLPDHVRVEDLIRFVRKVSQHWVTSASLGDVPFRDHDGAAIVHGLLERHGGRVAHFEMAQNNRDPLKRKALVKFATAYEASKACRYFENVKNIPELGGSRLLLTRVFVAKSALPNIVFSSIEKEVVAKLSELRDSRFTIYKNEVSTTISLMAEKPEGVSTAKSVLRPYITGDPIPSSDSTTKSRQLLQTLWRSSPRIIRSVETEIRKLNEEQYIQSCAGNRGINRIIGGSNTTGAAALVDRPKKEIRLFGTAMEKKLDLESKIFECVEKILGERKLTVSISDDDYMFLLQGGRRLIDKLVSMTLAQSISVDIKHRAIIVEGDADDAKRVVHSLHRLATLATSDSTCSNEAQDDFEEDEEKLCPVCFCTPGGDEYDDDDVDDNEEGILDSDDIVDLPCSHSYCRECFQKWLTGNRTCRYPLQCLSDGCNQKIPLDTLAKLLATDDFNRSMREAVDGHVNDNLDKFQFCFSPGCVGICPLHSLGHEEDQKPGSSSPQRLSICSTCDTVFCTVCKVEEHDGMTCKEYQAASQPPDQIRMKIIDDILTLQCPRCGQAFYDFDGCFALKCSSCPCGFCGWCLRDSGGEDAHGHVKHCPSKIGDDLYFGTKQQFDEAQRKRRSDKLIEYLQTQLSTREERVEALSSVKADLQDLGITIDLGQL